MRTAFIAAWFVVAVSVAAAGAQKATGHSNMHGMTQGMGAQKSGEGAMQGMGGMMGMMKMMEQCNAMMAAQSHESALDLLKKRYVKGEITKEQFDKIKKDIE